MKCVSEMAKVMKMKAKMKANQYGMAKINMKQQSIINVKMK